jgi:hypothetical protein
MGSIQVKIMQGKMPGFVDDKRPVPIGMGQFLEKHFHPIQNADIPLKNVEKHPVLDIHRHIDPGIGKICLKGFGFHRPTSMKKLHVMVHLYWFPYIRPTRFFQLKNWGSSTIWLICERISYMIPSSSVRTARPGLIDLRSEPFPLPEI